MELILPRASERRMQWAGRKQGSVWLLLLALPILFLLIVPLLALVTRIRLPVLISNLGNVEVIQAISLSLTTTAISTCAALLLGTPLAYLLARRRFRGRLLLDTLIDLPIVLPPSVAGIALLMAFGRRGLLGPALDGFGLSLAFSPTAVVLAQIFVAAPFFIKAATAGFAGTDQDLEHAAAIDGANGLQVFRFVTVPLTWTILVGGAVMTWARALGEFGATIIFAGNFPGRTQTMPLAIYIGLEMELNVALTLSVILLITSFAVLAIVKWLLPTR